MLTFIRESELIPICSIMKTLQKNACFIQSGEHVLNKYMQLLDLCLSSQGSFRGHLAASPQQSSSRRRTNENAVVHFFRSIVSSTCTHTLFMPFHTCFTCLYKSYFLLLGHTNPAELHSPEIAKNCITHNAE